MTDTVEVVEAAVADTRAETEADTREAGTAAAAQITEIRGVEGARVPSSITTITTAEEAAVTIMAAALITGNVDVQLFSPPPPCL